MAIVLYPNTLIFIPIVTMHVITTLGVGYEEEWVAIVI